MEKIRNFCIIAHIDHGKSTLADRILEMTDVVHTKNNEQLLDSMDLEKERGITIKASPVRIPYTSKSGEKYIFNLIDTPGHVDFNYEVSRSLYACEGALLLVDATQGVEAQTLANAYLAIDANLEIIPVINKIDLPHAMVDETKMQIEDMLGISAENALLVSAKSGEGVEELLEQLIELIPPPKPADDKPLQCLIFDSHYDTYRGVISHIRVFAGSVKAGDIIMIKSTGKTFEVEEVGYFGIRMERADNLAAGEVGYIAAVIRDVGDIHVGDTIISKDHKNTEAIPGFKRMKPMVFCGIYPILTNDYDKLLKALNKFQLNDSSIVFEKESSAALGHGFRIGFLGMLHMEISLERLKREFEQEIIATMPSVIYKVAKTNKEILTLDNPSKFPTIQEIDYIEEPIVRARIIVPPDFVGPCMELSNQKRGSLVEMEYPDPKRTVLVYDIPLAELIIDFYDKLKTVSRGYASLDYDFKGFVKGDLVKVDILVNGDQVDALSYISDRDSAVTKARKLVHRLLKLIPRQQFKVPLQGSINGKIIAREDIAPVRKDVLAKCYGGDVTRKKKLLEKQKEGKKRMKMVGSVEIPQEAFLSLLKVAEDEK
ncbi:MAG TPA: translation elongation factor 4 [Caldisericia bacterium]|nr:translation elongation factor 4 [Caldisericia bacterium]HPF49080.1 translation elongation factor 4 [Caldisericia bacterium]HPI83056.1 translation elongation factor 4 [Caldisericia bacterium]HPQ92283.1 translation elongation factor 4 [Caldisericia bacterium]HRV74619.1 translation elongation factor 4 [Caldisericia bacterium]